MEAQNMIEKGVQQWPHKEQDQYPNVILEYSEINKWRSSSVVEKHINMRLLVHPQGHSPIYQNHK